MKNICNGKEGLSGSWKLDKTNTFRYILLWIRTSRGVNEMIWLMIIRFNSTPRVLFFDIHIFILFQIHTRRVWILLQLPDMMAHYVRIYEGHFKVITNIIIFLVAYSRSQSLLIVHVGDVIVQDTNSVNSKHWLSSPPRNNHCKLL